MPCCLKPYMAEQSKLWPGGSPKGQVVQCAVGIHVSW